MYSYPGGGVHIAPQDPPKSHFHLIPISSHHQIIQSQVFIQEKHLHLTSTYLLLSQLPFIYTIQGPAYLRLNSAITMSDATTYTSKLQGKRVLVIGGSSGIGFAVACAAIESGCTVIISSSNPARIESSISRITTAYPSAASRISGHACDLSSRSIEANITSLFEKVGNLDHIVFTAGDSLQLVPLDDVTLEKLGAGVNIRIAGALLTAKIGRKYLSPGPASSITMTTGTIGQKPIPGGGWTLAAITGSGIHGLTRQLSLELAPIRVNAISPGAVETELWDPMGKEAFEGLKKMTVERMPTGRMAQPDDIAEAYLYMMKDKNVTGTILSTDSGTFLV
jgi:NAD(P)-dependent dehydrogenase (short-subunit alcohol dehydrogenase family)